MIHESSHESPRRADSELHDHLAALGAVRRIRTVFFILLLVGLLTPLVTFVAHAVGVLEVPNADRGLPLGSWAYRGVGHLEAWAAPVTSSTSILLILSYLLTVNVCLIGRLGSGRDAIVAFFWMAVVALFVCHGPRVTLEQLLAAAQAPRADWVQEIRYHAQFVVMPALVVLSALVADLRFATCYRDAVLRVRTRLGLEVAR